jgi:hypothetical protein
MMSIITYLHVIIYDKYGIQISQTVCENRLNMLDKTTIVNRKLNLDPIVELDKLH